MPLGVGAQGCEQRLAGARLSSLAQASPLASRSQRYTPDR
jgi:hypothetical protein